MTKTDVAIKLLQYVDQIVSEQMEYAKTHPDEKLINIAGFCAELKQKLGQEKAKYYGQL